MANKKGAVVGIGGIGIHHASWLKDTGRIDLVGLCDVNPQVAAKGEEAHPGVPFYSDMNALLEETRPDIVSLVVPHHLHAPLAIELMEKGVNVVVEKPMAILYDDCRRMIDVAKANDVFVTVFHNRRWDGWYLTAKSIIDQGMLGDLVELNIAIDFAPPPATWRGWKQRSGGIMYDWGVHLVDYALNLVDAEATDVSGFFYHRSGRDPELNEDHGNVRIYFANGATANVTCSGVAKTRPHRYLIYGTEGTLLDDWQSPEGQGMKVYKKLPGNEQVEMDVEHQPRRWQAFYDNVAAHLNGEEALAVTAESAARVIEVLNQAEVSHAKGGQPLPLSAPA